MKIERAHRVGDLKVSTKRTIVAKLASYKDKQNIFSKCNRLKGTCIYMNEDFTKEALEIRKQNWGKVSKTNMLLQFTIVYTLNNILFFDHSSFYIMHIDVN